MDKKMAAEIPLPIIAGGVRHVLADFAQVSPVVTPCAGNLTLTTSAAPSVIRLYVERVGATVNFGLVVGGVKQPPIYSMTCSNPLLFGILGETGGGAGGHYAQFANVSVTWSGGSYAGFSEWPDPFWNTDPPYGGDGTVTLTDGVLEFYVPNSGDLYAAIGNGLAAFDGDFEIQIDIPGPLSGDNCMAGIIVANADFSTVWILGADWYEAEGIWNVQFSVNGTGVYDNMVALAQLPVTLQPGDVCPVQIPARVSVLIGAPDQSWNMSLTDRDGMAVLLDSNGGEVGSIAAVPPVNLGLQLVSATQIVAGTYAGGVFTPFATYNGSDIPAVTNFFIECYSNDGSAVTETVAPVPAANFSIEQALDDVATCFLLTEKDDDGNWYCYGAQLDVWGQILDLPRVNLEGDDDPVEKTSNTNRGYRNELIAKVMTLYSNGTGDELLNFVAQYIQSVVNGTPNPLTLYGTSLLNNSLAVYNNVIYNCIAAVGPTATTPDVDTTHWQVWAGSGQSWATGYGSAWSSSGVYYPNSILTEYFPASQIVRFQTTAEQSVFIQANGVRLKTLLKQCGGGGIKTVGIMLTPTQGREFQLGGAGSDTRKTDPNHGFGLSTDATKSGGQMGMVVQ